MDVDPTPAAGRSIDIELGSQEVITIDLDNLDPNPEDVLELLREGQCKTWVWTKLAGEYWRKGLIDAAEKIAQAAVESFSATGSIASLPPIYSLLANIQIAHARQAPKMHLPDARQDILTGQKTKEEFYREAATYLNAGDKVLADTGHYGDSLSFLTRGVHQLATRSMDDALRSFEGVIAEKPTNLVAILGKARILYTLRKYPQALKLFQRVLELNPRCLPDPRIGIGLCFWAMEHKDRAKAAWERSLKVNPTEWSNQLLLGLEAINTSKADHFTEAERAMHFTIGTRYIERAFKANQKSAAAANALCEFFILKGDHNRALKLAERAIQFADTLPVLTDGHLRAGRVSHAEGLLPQATKHYMAATDGQPKHVLGAIGLAQMQMKNEEMAAAIHTLDTLVTHQSQPQNSGSRKSLEAMVMLASLRAFPRPGVSSSDVALERTKARELFDRLSKALELDDMNRPGHLNAQHGRNATISDDVDMYAEMARLWQSENLERTGRALKEALRISQTSGAVVDPRLLNNLGALAHMDGKLTDARAMYESALMSASSDTVGGKGGEAMATSILYNLARVYEDEGEQDLAKDAYTKLLSRHPEYVDAKLRQAVMLSNLNRHNDAHELLKECLTSQSNNLNLRAYYTYFLMKTNTLKQAKEFVFATLKDHDKHDVYSICAAGWIHYNQSRDNRDSSPKAAEERKKGYQRSAEFYEKALHLDPMCAIAAQGLAIVTAEDALGALAGGPSGIPLAASASEEANKRFKNARDALDVLAKVRESVNDGSVYFNMGHCYYARDEFDRAIESYETASTRFYNGQDVPTLMCLCRSWYAKAIKDSSFSSMNTAFRYAQMALHVQPNDKSFLYNIAMIHQKAAQILFGLAPAKRSLKDLQLVIEQATHAQKIFASLASVDKSQPVPYSREIADQRRKFGDNLLRKGDEHIQAQKDYESEVQTKLDAARSKRQEERNRLDTIERARMEEKRIQNEKLAEERRIAREQALEWTREVKMESDEERERKSKKVRKSKTEGGSGEEGAAGEGQPKKKRRTKKSKAASEEGGEAEALFSDEEEGEKPTKKRVAKKRILRDDDEEDTAAGPRKKQFKSKEMLSDTDDEDMS